MSSSDVGAVPYPICINWALLLPPSALGLHAHPPPAAAGPTAPLPCPVAAAAVAAEAAIDRIIATLEMASLRLLERSLWWRRADGVGEFGLL